MPLYGERKDILSLELVEYIKTAVEGFRENKSLSSEEILELFDHKVVSRVVKDLGLKVKVEELIEDPAAVAVVKETPLEIIGRIVTKVENNEMANSSMSPRGNGGSPEIVL